MGLKEVNAGIAKAAARVGRATGEITLVAVSKKQEDARVEAVLAEGHRVFGENRVQEAAGKWPGFKERYENVELRLIGPLQSNKARQAMELFDVIETLDRAKLATAIARLAQELGHCPRLYIQINTGEEDQKAGVAPRDADAFVAQCRDLGLSIEGLMCIPPSGEEPSLHFALLAKIAARNGIEKLSMGMSGDYDTAVGQGATSVRVGSAIFGERAY